MNVTNNLKLPQYTEEDIIQLKQELDKAKKLDIAKRITEIKKGSVWDGRN